MRVPAKEDERFAMCSGRVSRNTHGNRSTRRAPELSNPQAPGRDPPRLSPAFHPSRILVVQSWSGVSERTDKVAWGRGFRSVP